MRSLKVLKSFLPFVVIFFYNLSSKADETLIKSFNETLIETIQEMPQGGTYSTRSDAFESLFGRIKIQNNKLKVDHLSKGPSFCSSATYVVFMKTLEKLVARRQVTIPSKVLSKLLVKDEEGKWLADGFGVWGRWNANGPGTAGLFFDLNLGDNFSDDQFKYAKAGDFLKMFWIWGQGVGKLEKGHSVIFTGVLPRNAQGAAVEKVCFWSSHGYDDGRESGFGEKCVPRTDIQNMIFSRLSRPENFKNLQSAQYQFENTYLSSLLDKVSSIEEAREKTGTKVLGSN
jgi:hypothetical protein